MAGRAVTRAAAKAALALAVLGACARPEPEPPAAAATAAGASETDRFAARLAATMLPLASRGDEGIAAPGATGVVEGVARWEGSTPLKIKQLTNTVDVATCGERVNPGSVVALPTGELANAFIELRPVDAPRRHAEPIAAAGPPVIVTMTRCLADPHVLVVPLGSGVEVRNADPVRHDLVATCVRNPSFRVDLPRYRKRAIVAAGALSREERIQVTDDAHPWAVSWWVVTGSRLRAVTGRDGRFRIEGVPPGPWRLVAWHEELGEIERTVDAHAGQATEAVIAWR